jgi:DNA polymerase-3 subunit gamma/tau
LVLGSRNFPSEISAYCSAFLKNPTASGTKLLFFRALRKLQLRFSPVLIENDPVTGKLSSVLQSLDERLNELLMLKTDTEKQVLETLCKSLVDNAMSLYKDGLKDRIPINHIRNAAYWCRLAPNGNRKTLIIENAENMREDGRNSLLKLLEEPPDTVSIILTAQRREAIMPTILSRLRPYRFLNRSEEDEKEVLKRIFKYSVDASPEYTSASAFLNSFLPQSTEKMREIAAWFIVSLARINVLGERYASLAESSGMARTFKITEIVKLLTAKCGNFEGDSFSVFFKHCLDLISDALKEINDPVFLKYAECFKKHTNQVIMGVDILNQSPALVLEGFLYDLRADFARDEIARG